MIDEGEPKRQSWIFVGFGLLLYVWCLIASSKINDLERRTQELLQRVDYLEARHGK